MSIYYFKRFSTLSYEEKGDTVTDGEPTPDLHDKRCDLAK